MQDRINRARIKGLIYENGYNQTSFAAKCGVTKETLNQFLAGKTPSFRVVDQIVTNLKLEPETAGILFFGDTYTV